MIPNNKFGAESETNLFLLPLRIMTAGLTIFNISLFTSLYSKSTFISNYTTGLVMDQCLKRFKEFLK